MLLAGWGFLTRPRAGPHARDSYRGAPLTARNHMTNFKACNKCGDAKPHSSFPSNGPGKLRSACKECEAARYAERHARTYVPHPRPKTVSTPRPKAAPKPRRPVKRGHPMYGRWRAMLSRCSDPKHQSYHRYGGRGIEVCAEWRRDFWAFAAFWGAPPFPEASMDRVDNNGPYAPDNCRWATQKQQCRNQSQTRMVCIDGSAIPLIELAESAGMHPDTLKRRLARDSRIEYALFSPHGNLKSVTAES